MINTMTLDGYTAVISYDPERERFRGSNQGLNGGADFYGTNPEELRQEFRASLDFFIETCAKRGIAVKKPPSGNLMLRIPPEVHGAILTAARAEGKTLNQWASKVLAEAARAA